MAGDPKKDMLSNLVALDVIDRRFGDGKLLSKMLEDNEPLLKTIRGRSAREGAAVRITTPVSGDMKAKADDIISGGKR